ncbi:MAG TPA: SDR family oxidoreductase [Tepidisphaeraceae bacterium]|jgi:uncharacterized protein YbjT (DUF2867 family)
MILVTGGTGTAGGEIVSQLAATGTPFRAMVRDVTKAAALKLTGVEVVPGDLDKPETLPAALKGIDQVMLVSPPMPRQAELEGNMVAAAKRAGVRHIVKFSAMTADPNSKARFPRLHGITERAIVESAIAWTFLRPTFFMQNMLDLAGMVRGGTIYQPCGDARAGFVDTADIAAVAVEALTEPGHEGTAYDITGPELLSYHDVARIFSEVLGKPVKYQDVPPAAARDGLLAAGIPEWSADGILELCDQMRAGEYARLTTVIEDVGKKEPISLAAFVREHADAFR